MLYFLTAMGLTPGDSSTIHIYTQTIHRTTQSTQTIHSTTQQRLVTRHSEDSDRRNKICDRFDVHV